jgi:hypothetical protein
MVYLMLKLFLKLAEAILTDHEPTTVEEISLADARTWPQEQGERDVFLVHDSEDESKNEEEDGLKVRSSSSDM